MKMSIMKVKVKGISKVLGGLAILALSTACPLCAAAGTSKDFHDWAKTPPMGWNSFDRFLTYINEDECREQADAQAELLLKHGWNIFVLDHRWYSDDTRQTPLKEGDPIYIDKFGRAIPSDKKFPSSAKNLGLKPLADYVHSKGMKFGIHIMRGIPRYSVEKNTPVKGTNFRASDIADKSSTCPWCPDMYGIDMQKPGAQEYYDSILELYASWGVDFIKVDDISRPYSYAEIEAIRKAIDKTGRPILLSLSPGDTPLDAGQHPQEHANMWRISDDFWDRWNSLKAMFVRLHNWSNLKCAGSWPDADMLPFGKIEGGRPTNFTKDEQRTCMTLWCIARSPLILGADMTNMDDWTLSLLTNREVLDVNQKSTNNRQLFREGNLVAWVADIPGSKDKYLALFNAETAGVNLENTEGAAAASGKIGREGSKSASLSADIRGSKKIGLYVGDGGDGISYDHAVWLNPTLKGPKGELKLASIPWEKASAGWGQPKVNSSTDGAKIEGIGTHAASLIIWNLPEGYETFSATVGLADGCQDRGKAEFFVLTDSALNKEIPEELELSVNLADLGFKGPVKIRDIWEGKDLGSFKGKFSRKLRSHASGLYRLSPR